MLFSNRRFSAYRDFFIIGLCPSGNESYSIRFHSEIKGNMTRYIVLTEEGWHWHEMLIELPYSVFSNWE